ncbi:MAG: hypothetical protein ACREVQ_14315 [Burkholderiales bacterium]
MDTCTVESGLLRKKVCGKPAVTHCLNCETGLCADHAVAEMSEAGKRTGKFLCAECKAALKDMEKRLAAVEKKAPPAEKKPVAPAPATAAAAPKAPEAPKPPEKKETGGLDFK